MRTRPTSSPPSPLRALTSQVEIAAADPDFEAQRIQARWLVQLRWNTAAGQLLTVLLVDKYLHLKLPLAALFVVLGIEAASNLAFAAWARRARWSMAAPLALPLALDILLLSLLLFLTGGPFNPFSFLYLVHIALAAVVLPALWTWGLVGLSLVCFGLLFADQAWLQTSLPTQLSHADQMRMHMQGMWFAFAVAAVFITYFVTRVRESLALRELELLRARALASQAEKLASLATLAAGAAHELSTPLSTIAVITKELERSLVSSDEAVRNDVRSIRHEVERCREILQRMAADAGQSEDEESRPLRLRELLDSAVTGLPRRNDVRLHLAADAAESVLRAPAQATAQALRGVLKNALQATALDGHIDIEAELHGGQCRIAVRDSGSGMSDDVLARAGEPFFTTKDPGEGMGLGLFLTRVVVERAGGQMQLHSRLGEGTTAVLTLPLLSATNHRIRA